MAAPKKTTRARAPKDVDLTKDQTRDEAEEAAALVSEITVNEPQTEGEALLANVIAEESTFAKTEGTKSKTYKIKVLEEGLVVKGAFLLKGSTVEVDKEIWEQTEDVQKESYGSVYFTQA